MRRSDSIFDIRRQLAELAMFFFLLTVAPVYAMSRIEGREFQRQAIVQVISPRRRNRALGRRHLLDGAYTSYVMIG